MQPRPTPEWPQQGYASSAISLDILHEIAPNAKPKITLLIGL